MELVTITQLNYAKNGEGYADVTADKSRSREKESVYLVLQKLIMKITSKLRLWSGVLLKKLIITQLVKTFPVFYGTKRFITVFTRTDKWSLS
jgi:hypothetical protein